MVFSVRVSNILLESSSLLADDLFLNKSNSDIQQLVKPEHVTEDQDLTTVYEN